MGRISQSVRMISQGVREAKRTTGVPGDHVRHFHDRVVSEIVSLARAAGIYAKGGHTGTCKGIFSKCMGAYNLNEHGQRLLQGIVPDGFLDAQGRGGPANTLSGRRHIFEHKTLASLLISVQKRARQVRHQQLRFV